VLWLLVCLISVFCSIKFIYFLIDPIPCAPIDRKNNNIIERPRPKGNSSDAFNRSASMRTGDFNQTTTNTCKRQSSLRQCDLPSIQEAKYKNSLPNTSNMDFY